MLGDVATFCPLMVTLLYTTSCRIAVSSSVLTVSVAGVRVVEFGLYYTDSARETRVFSFFSFASPATDVYAPWSDVPGHRRVFDTIHVGVWWTTRRGGGDAGGRRWGLAAEYAAGRPGDTRRLRIASLSHISLTPSLSHRAGPFSRIIFSLFDLHSNSVDVKNPVLRFTSL